MKLAVLLHATLLGVLSVPVYAQELPVQHVVTAQPSDARFEIVQSTLAFRWTFRLDRYTGVVEQLVSRKEDDGDEVLSWQAIPIEEKPEIGKATKPRFQIFLSGIGAKGTFLLDTLEGYAWIFTVVKRDRADGSTYESNEWRILRRAQ